MRRLRFAILLFIPQVAFGWGTTGHRIVAAIAMRQLSPAIAEEINILLDGHSLVEVSTLPDTWRPNRPLTGPWHFANIPLGADTFVVARDCPHPRCTPGTRDCLVVSCIVSALDRYGAVLRNPAAPAANRAEAIVFLTHFMGDLHQPLHCADNDDQGGNAVHVTFLGTPTNLHAVWDSSLITYRETANHLNEEGYVAYLLNALANRDPASLESGTIVEWANASHLLARQAYRIPADHALGQEYSHAMLSIVDEQLLRAGLRLAHILTVALTQPAPGVFSRKLLERAREGIPQKLFHSCPIEGDAKGDPRLNALKNRVIPPPVYHDVTVTNVVAIHPTAAEAMGRRQRHEWTNPALQSVFPYEQRGVRITGYLLAKKHEGPESCNCHSDTDRDFHLWLAVDATSTKDHAMVVEISPREVPDHNGWTEANLQRIVSTHTPVRISGWLMWDQEHGSEVGKSRGTLWEIHPIHKIEVRTKDGWIDVDTLP